MKRMICYFLLCALVLTCIAGCLSAQNGEITDPTGSASLQGTQNNQTQGTQDPDFTMPTYDLETLPTIDREPIGTLPGVDPEQQIFILTGKNDILFINHWGNNAYCFSIFSKKPLDVDSISVKLPISAYYRPIISEKKLKGVQELDVNVRMDERYYAPDTFTYPMYLAYRGKDFRKLAELKVKFEQLRELISDLGGMLFRGEITKEEYNAQMQPYWDAQQEYEDYLNAEYQDYLALTKADLPQFYVYSVIVSFTNLENLGAKLEKEETFTQIEVTIGDETYVQDVGKVTLIEDWELPAPLDWETANDAVAGIMGSANSPMLYNDGIHCIDTYFHFVADRYKLLEELVMLNPAQKVERVWLRIRPESGAAFVVEWDMSEPYEIYPGDDVTVYAAYRDENLNTLGYQTMTDAYLMYTTDGESFCKFSHSSIAIGGSNYRWYAILFDGIDLESYYWDYYYQFYEPWRLDPEEDPVWYD